MNSAARQSLFVGSGPALSGPLEMVTDNCQAEGSRLRIAAMHSYCGPVLASTARPLLLECNGIDTHVKEAD